MNAKPVWTADAGMVNDGKSIIADCGCDDLESIKFAEQIAREHNAHAELVATLTDLVRRCDGAEGVRADGSNIDTCRANYLLALLEKGDGP